MKIQSNCLLFARLLTGTNMFSQASGTGRVTRSAPTPAAQQPATSPPTPLPPKGMMVTGDTPQYSPMLLDFGTLREGESAKKTFSLIVPRTGEVRLIFSPDSNFSLVEFREMEPVKGGSKNFPAQMGSLAARQVKSHTTYPTIPGNGQKLDLKRNLETGSAIEVDIVLRPMYEPCHYCINEFGPKSTVLRVSGQGLRMDWIVSIPVRGTFGQGAAK